ncbi:MAG: anti-sigma factor antagonist [Anaerolineae bacterium]|nr:anti-sigma factor antagonist [Anaerolineae bacterium]
MAVERQLTIAGLLENVPEACDFVVAAAETAGLDERAVYHCQMAVDEWCTNVIQHNYGQDSEYRHIDIQCRNRADQFVITVMDDGVRFDPTTLAEVDPGAPLEERQPGGLGWFFIRKLMDQVSYEYKNGRNHLTMIKYGTRPDQSTRTPYPVNELYDGIWVVTPSGRLDSNNARLLETTLTALFEEGRTRLIVDMSSVVYISSSGLKVLVAAWRKAQKLGGSVLLAGVSVRVREILEISGFDALFTITPSVEEAITSIKGSA